MNTVNFYLEYPTNIIKDENNKIFSFISPFTKKAIECFVYNSKEEYFERSIKEYLLYQNNIILDDYNLEELKHIFSEQKQNLHSYIENNPDQLKFQELYILDTIETLEFLNTPGQGFCKKINNYYGIFLNFFENTNNIEEIQKNHIKENHYSWSQIFDLKSIDYYSQVFKRYEKDFLLFHELGHARAIHEYISLEFEREMEADFLAIMLLNKYNEDFNYKDFIISLLIRRGIKKSKSSYYINHYTDYSLLFLLKNIENSYNFKRMENEDLETSSLKMLKTFREEKFYKDILNYSIKPNSLLKKYKISKIKSHILDYGDKYVARNINNR